MKPFQETNFIAKDKENEQWKSSLPPEEVKEKMLAQRGFTQENGSKIQFDHTVFIQYAMTRVHALYCNGKLYFYNFKSKCYEYLEDHAYKKIFFAIIEEASCNIWKRKQENEYIPYFKRKVPYAEDNGMRPGLLQFQNCIFDLQEETIEKPTPDIFCLVQIPYDYDPKAKAPQFFRFLQELFDNDQTRIDLVQEIMGACLYYEDIMQKLVVFLGSGSNGKSLLSNMIKHMLGERNVSAVALDQISSGRFGKQNLDRKLLNISSETKTEKLYSTADLKALTGGDSIEIEEKFEKSYTTEIHSKFILLANDMIQTKDYSDGFYRRLLIIPFEQCFHDLAPNQEPEEGVLYKNIYLEGDLMQELPGIFNFAYAGLERLIDNDYNFTYSPACEAALEHYKNEHNVVKAFYNHCIVLPEPKHKKAERTAVVYAGFLSYCRENRFPCSISSIQFHRMFQNILTEEGTEARMVHRNRGDFYLHLQMQF